jgi:hypothetical protein
MTGIFDYLRRLTRSAIADDAAANSVTGRNRTYCLGALLAEGDAADVYLAAEGNHLLKVAAVPEGNAFLEQEESTLAALSAAAGDTTYRKYLPALVESAVTDDTFRRRVHVFRFEPGFYTLEQVHERHPALDGQHLAWVFNRLLTVLGFTHRRGWVHGAVLPCHVMIHAADHGLRLVGWGQSATVGRPVRAFPARYQSWYPPEILRRQAAGPATDLFMAARCLIYLAGGDPVHDRMPEAVPTAMRGFVKTCLLESVRMRPGDAWQLLDEFDAMLRRLYGPPKFHELTMN